MLILIELGIIDHFQSSDNDESFRIIINAFADYFFDEEDESVFTFLPSDPTDTDWIYFHFREAGYDADWYDLVTGKFSREIKFFADDIARNICDNLSGYSDEEMEQFVLDFVSRWCGNCRSALKEKIHSSAENMRTSAKS